MVATKFGKKVQVFEKTHFSSSGRASGRVFCLSVHVYPSFKIFSALSPLVQIASYQTLQGRYVLRVWLWFQSVNKYGCHRPSLTVSASPLGLLVRCFHETVRIPFLYHSYYWKFINYF